jgi:hypothetical protein
MTKLTKELDIDQRIEEILWPHPFSGSGGPLQVGTNSGLPPEGKVFVAPYSLIHVAIKRLLADVIEAVTPERQQVIHDMVVTLPIREAVIDEITRNKEELGL